MICKLFGHKWAHEYTPAGTAIRRCTRCGTTQVRRHTRERNDWREYEVTK